jgi:hypothetical protein
MRPEVARAEGCLNRGKGKRGVRGGDPARETAGFQLGNTGRVGVSLLETTCGRDDKVGAAFWAGAVLLGQK